MLPEGSPIGCILMLIVPITKYVLSLSLAHTNSLPVSLVDLAFSKEFGPIGQSPPAEVFPHGEHLINGFCPDTSMNLYLPTTSGSRFRLAPKAAVINGFGRVMGLHARCTELDAWDW